MDKNLEKFYLEYKKKNWKYSDLSAEYKKLILDHFLKKIKIYVTYFYQSLHLAPLFS